MATFPDLSTDKGLKALDEYLLLRSYITGYDCQYACKDMGMLRISIKDRTIES